MAYGKCFLCEREGTIERHHIFGGPFRSKSNRMGLVVDLCHYCHNEPPYGAHHCRQTADRLHRYGQRKAMIENGWDIDDFVREFGKNYLTDEELDDIEFARQEAEARKEERETWRKVIQVKVKDSMMSASFSFDVRSEVLPF